MNKLELTDEQLKLISKALDMYSRLSMGQFKYVTDDVTVQDKVWNMFPEERNEFENIMLRAGELMTGRPKHGSYGIYNKEVNDDARLAGHIHQAIRHEFWKRDTNVNKNSSTVNAYPADMIKGLVINITKTDS